MSFPQAFPALQPQAELQWLAAHTLQCDDLQQELRFCTSLCALIHCVKTTGAAAEVRLDFMVRGAAKDNDLHATNSPFYCLVYRTLCASINFMRSWRDPTDKVSLNQLYTLLGVMSEVNEQCPQGQLDKMEVDIPRTLSAWRAACVEVELCADWAERIFNPMALNEPMRAEKPATKLIDWSYWKMVHDATQLYHNGCYSKAAVLLRTLVDKHNYVPPHPVLPLLNATARKEFVDLPPLLAPLAGTPLSRRRGIKPLTIACVFK
jgi:hypothetical protein